MNAEPAGSIHQMAESQPQATCDSRIPETPTSNEPALFTGDPKFTEGLNRFIIANDGTKDCLAFLMDKEMFELLRKIRNRSQELDRLEPRVWKAQNEVFALETTFRLAKAELDEEHSQDSHQSLQESPQQIETKLQKATEKKNNLERDLGLLTCDVDYSKCMAQDTFNEAMEQAGLVALEDQNTEATSIADADKTDDDDYSNDDYAAESAEYELSELDKARKTYHESFVKLNKVQNAFDGLRATYHNDVIEFEADLAQGFTQWTRTDFDLVDLRNNQYATRALIDAEATLDEARERAEALGAFDDGWNQSSYYGGSQRTHVSIINEELSPQLAALVEKKVESWRVKVPEVVGDEINEAVDIDDWDAKTVEMSDSVSIADFSWVRRRIDRWHDACERVRCEWRSQQLEAREIDE